jgi:hypothetical protein
MSSPSPANQHKPLQAGERHAILDMPPETASDRMRLASHLLDVPIVVVTIVDRGRQWFKPSYGAGVKEIGRDLSFGAHAILTNKQTIVPDLRLDRRFASNALVMGNLTKTPNRSGMS